jgi:ribosome-binding protein aMBF1 (putative translation factor)
MKPTDLAESIRQAIRASSKSANQLAIPSAVDKGIITRFLRGERSITVETAGKLLAALGCEIEIKGPKADARLVPVKPKRRRASNTDETDEGR